jgi:hypothetical protein
MTSSPSWRRSTTLYKILEETRLIRDKIGSHLQHAKSFEKVISACAQTNQIISLIRGAAQAAIVVWSFLHCYSKVVIEKNHQSGKAAKNIT